MSTRRRSTRKSGVGAAANNAPLPTDTGDTAAPTKPSGPVGQPRITPRNSLVEDATASPSKETPYSALRKLANRPTTPIRRASSAGPTSTIRTARRTPGAQNITPGGIAGPSSTRRPTAATPHGRAAMREIEMRRAAALTPGKDRRRSGRQQRETPRDFLRELSKVLAPGTKPVVVSPEVQEVTGSRLPFTRLNDVDDEPVPPRPRLSMPLGDNEDEDDSLLLPPHSDALLDDDDITQQSVELPRRAISEQPGGRLSRGSLGSIRTSDRFDQTMQELGLDNLGSEEFDPTIIHGNFDDDDGEPMWQDDPSILSERTGTVDIRDPFEGEGLRRVSAASGRPSDVHRPFLDDEHEATFAFTVPQRDDMAANAQSANARAPKQSLGPVLEEPEQDPEEEEDVEDEGSDEAEEDNEPEEEFEAEIEEEGSDIDPMDPLDATMNDTVMSAAQAPAKEKQKPKRVKKPVRVSRHGIQYSSLPAGVVKKLATTFSRTGGSSNSKISKDTLAAIMQASDWFFEQVSDDLGAYAAHANRKTIDENDVITLMKR